MTAHELAAILLAGPDLPVATHADNHTSIGDRCRVALAHTYNGDHILIGNADKKNINRPNWYIVEMLDGGPDLPDEWRRAGQLDFDEPRSQRFDG